MATDVEVLSPEILANRIEALEKEMLLVRADLAQRGKGKRGRSVVQISPEVLEQRSKALAAAMADAARDAQTLQTITSNVQVQARLAAAQKSMEQAAERMTEAANAIRDGIRNNAKDWADKAGQAVSGGVKNVQSGYRAAVDAVAVEAARATTTATAWMAATAALVAEKYHGFRGLATPVPNHPFNLAQRVAYNLANSSPLAEHVVALVPFIGAAVTNDLTTDRRQAVQAAQVDAAVQRAVRSVPEVDPRLDINFLVRAAVAGEMENLGTDEHVNITALHAVFVPRVQEGLSKFQKTTLVLVAKGDKTLAFAQVGDEHRIAKLSAESAIQLYEAFAHQVGIQGLRGAFTGDGVTQITRAYVEITRPEAGRLEIRAAAGTQVEANRAAYDASYGLEIAFERSSPVSQAQDGATR